MSQTNEVEVRKDQSNDEVLQWVTFQLEEETYGINVMQVREVLRYTEIAPVPGAPDYVLGIINKLYKIIIFSWKNVTNKGTLNCIIGGNVIAMLLEKLFPQDNLVHLW